MLCLYRLGWSLRGGKGQVTVIHWGVLMCVSGG